MEITLLVCATIVACGLPAISFSAPPTDEEQRQIEMLIGAYYRAVAAEDVDEVVDLHHWANSFERDKVKALVEPAFAVADSEFERVRIQSIDVYPERGIGLARVGIDYRIRSYDGADAFSGHLDAAVVLIKGTKGWRIGRVGRAADLDLTAAVSQFAAKTTEFEKSVPHVSDVVAETTTTNPKLPKLAAAATPGHQSGSTGPGTQKSSTSAASPSGGLTFYALRRKTTGDCEVVAGAEGIAPGDTIFGAFPDFGGAQEALTANCGGGQSADAVPVFASTASGQPLTEDRLYSPDDTVTRGQWGTVTRIGGNEQFAGAKEGGRAIEDGFFVHPGNGGPTEVVYQHDGSPVILKGTAAVLDCVDHCGQLGTVDFIIRGDGQEIWNGGLIRQHDSAVSFSVSLEGVHEIRLITTDGGNGTAHDWAAWLDLALGEEAGRSSQVRRQRPLAPLRSPVARFWPCRATPPMSRRPVRL